MQVITCILHAVSDLYKALAAPARRAILDELQERDGRTLFDLCTRLTTGRGLDMSRQAVSQHLDVLESAGLVVCRWDGRSKFHYLNKEPLRAIHDRWPVETPNDREEPADENHDDQRVCG